MSDRKRWVGALLAASGLVVLATPLAAQSWRTMNVARQIDGERTVDVRVRYGAGQLHIRPGPRGTLYRMDLRYDEEAFDPLSEFDGRRLIVGVDSRNRKIRVRKDRSGEMTLALTREVPMSLDLEFGAVRADVDLGGLRLTDLELSTGASESRIDVSAPNPEVLSSARVQVGAADFSARRLGNLNVERLSVDAGVGAVMLDFSGELRRNAEVSVKMGLGSLELRFPEGVGVRLVKKAFLASLDSEGLIKRGDAYYSPDWDEADLRISVRVEAAFGAVKVVWLN
jgi:hypothetical protein